MRSSSGKLLKVRPDSYVEPMPDIFMVEIAVEENQIITLPTPNLTQSTVNHTIDLYDSYNGTILQSSSTTATPTITRTLLADTEYYIKLRGIVTEFMFNMQIVGNGTAVPVTEDGIVSITVGTPVTNQYSYNYTDSWFKFKTTSASNYTISSPIGTYTAYNYNINWDYIGGTIPNVTGVTTWNSASATYTYEHAGTYIIAITGIMPGWSVANTSNMRLLITKCISWGNVGLKVIDWYGCTAMTTLPAQTSKLIDVLRFTNFCRDCTSLVSIPYGIFFDNVNVAIFSYAFYNCISLRSVPGTTFMYNVNAKLFDFTFANCNKITTLPSKLFEFCYKVTSFTSTFSTCTLLNNLPVDLFYRAIMDIDYSKLSVSSFNNTFYQCTSLTSIPSGFFSSPQVDNLGLNVVKGSTFQLCFYQCTSLLSIPEYFFHNQIYCTNSQWTLNSCTSLTIIPRSCFEGCYALLTVGSTTYISGSKFGVFGNNTSLVTIEQDCFKDCTSCTDFSYICGYDNNLVSVGDNMFDNCISSTTYAYAFYQCTSFTTPCANIFDDSHNVTSFNCTFTNTRIHSDYVVDVYQLDPNIFAFNTLVQDFSNVFSYNPNIVIIPEFIFSTCVEVNTFFYSFGDCINLSIIPPLIFRYNYKVRVFSQTFRNCTSITRIPIIIENEIEHGLFYFNPQVRTFCQTFSNCRLSDGVDYVAIPQITFYNNLEVTGIFNGYPYQEPGSFYGTFQSNINLQSIPDYLFLYNSKAQDFDYTFAGCTNINFNYLPAHLFQGVTNADRFNYTFDAVKIISIPDTLFEDCVAVKSFIGTFRGTAIISIPSGLFGTITTGPKGTPNNFTYTFQNCASLLTIAADLFYYNINATTFAYCFAGCTSIVSVPNTLFKINGTITTVTNDMSYIFNGCTKLVDIGTNLFKYNTGVLTFASAFNGCIKLKQEPTIFYNIGEESTRFVNKTMTFTSCFYRTGFNALDLYMGYSLSYNGTIITNDDNTAGNYQPQLTRTLLANTNYYIKITIVGAVDSGVFDILVTGGTGPGTPDPEVDCVLLSIGTTLVGEAISGGQVLWYKFKTTTAGSYVFKTMQNSTEITNRQDIAPELWNCTFNYTPVTNLCWGGAGNNTTSLSNYSNIPTIWKT